MKVAIVGHIILSNCRKKFYVAAWAPFCWWHRHGAHLKLQIEALLERPNSPRRSIWLLSLAVPLVVAAVWLRSWPAPRWTAPELAGEGAREFPQPMQMISPSAEARVDELAALMPPPRADSYLAAWRKLPGDCPRASSWLDGEDGQSVARVVAQLTTGTDPEALGALSLLLALCRHLEWEPDGFGASRGLDAEKLATLHESWIGLRAELGADRPMLAEASIVAVLAWARLMRESEQAPLTFADRAVAARAQARLEAWFAPRSERRTRLSASLAARQPLAHEALVAREGALQVLDAAARRILPDLDGECAR